VESDLEILIILQMSVSYTSTVFLSGGAQGLRPPANSDNIKKAYRDPPSRHFYIGRDP
jgi:hypothetical protein